MNRIFIYTLVAVFCFHACTPKDNGHGAPEELPMKEISNEVDIQDVSLVQRAKVVHPQKDIVIGKVDKAIFRDSLLYLIDRQRMEVNVVDTKGCLVGKIASRGRGNNEYLELTDAFVDGKSNTINILSRANRKLYVYDLHTYKLKKILSLPLSFIQMVKIQNGYVAYMGNYTEKENEPYNIWLLSDSMEIRGHESLINPIMESRVSWGHSALSLYEGVCHAVCEMDYIVYSVGKEIEQSYVVDFGKYNLPNQTKEMYDNPGIQLTNQTKYICDILNFQETKDKILIHTIFQGEYQLIIFDKQTHKTSRVVLNQGIREFLPLGFGRIVGIDSEHIVTIVENETIKTLYRGYDEYNNYEELYPEQIKHLREVIPAPYENDNACFIVYDL